MSINLNVTVDTNGNPTVMPHELVVHGDKKNVKLVWSMETDGYEISNITNLDPPEFTGKSKYGGTGYEIKDKNDHPDSYTYTVEVNCLKTGRKTTVDPTIKNEG